MYFNTKLTSLTCQNLCVLDINCKKKKKVLEQLVKPLQFQGQWCKLLNYENANRTKVKYQVKGVFIVQYTTLKMVYRKEDYCNELK